MRILILGAGAVGGYIGAKLVAAGADVTFLARGDRLARLEAEGLRVESPLGNFSGAVKTIGSAAPDLRPDVVIVACKAPALGGALEGIAPCVGPGTRILTLLNGVAHLETVHERFPQSTLLGGVAHGALTLRQDGVIEHLTPFFSAILGPVDGASDPVADELATILSRTGTDARMSANIRQDLWSKFVFLTTLAGITCLMRASIGTIVATAQGRKLVVQLLSECLSVAKAEGFAPDAGSMESYKRLLTEGGSALTSSMLRDIQRGRRTEGDHILGDMLERAKRHDIDTPVLAIARTHLQCYEATAAATSA